MKPALIFATLSFAFLGILMIVRGGTAPTPSALQTTSATDLESAVMRARDENKVVLAIATADWCPPCQVYKRNALVDTRVEEWIADNAVTVTLDVTDPQQPNPDAQALGVNGIPATYIVNAEGELVANAVGAMSADDLLTMLNAATN